MPFPLSIWLRLVARRHWEVGAGGPFLERAGEEGGATGERSVEYQGYLTLDLRRYAHPLLTFALPLAGLLFGHLPLPGACVWIRPSYFRTVREERLISAAELAANLVCLILLSIPLQLGIDQWTALGFALAGAASLQVGVMIFNLLPIPPLDGWNILSAGFSTPVRIQAASLGWMPLIAAMVLMGASPELSGTYWSLVEGGGALFAVDWMPALAGRSTLYL